MNAARRFGTVIGLVVLCGVLWILTPHFMTVSNLLNVAEQTSINAVVAVGMTFVILSAGIDLSVGSIVALAGVVLGAALQAGQPLPLALGLMFGSGIANMIYVIPSQTMFQERTPPDMIGRVVGFRFALVFGSMTLAMGISGFLCQAFGVAPVIGLFGLMTMVAGLAGLFVPAVRDA